MPIVTKLNITKERIYIDKPDYIFIEDNKEVFYRVRRLANSNGFSQDYLVRVDDEKILQDIISMEREEFRTRIIEEVERIRVFNTKGKIKLMDEITIVDLIKHKFKQHQSQRNN